MVKLIRKERIQKAYKFSLLYILLSKVTESISPLLSL